MYWYVGGLFEGRMIEYAHQNKGAINMTIGDKILNLRKARGWSQEELAERIGVTRQAVSRWESNSAKPDADKIVDICDLFGMSADYLLRDKYAGEGECAPAEATDSGSGMTVFQMLGMSLILISVLLICALGIMSALNPHTHWVDGVKYSGILGYIMGNQLWWLVHGDVLLLIAGILLLMGKEIACFVQNANKEKK